MVESQHPIERLQAISPDVVHNIRPLMMLSQTLEDMSSEELEEFVYLSGARGHDKSQLSRRLDISVPMLDVFMNRNTDIRRAYNNGVAYYIDNMEAMLMNACMENNEFALKVLQSKFPDHYNRKAVDVNLNTPPIREEQVIEQSTLKEATDELLALGFTMSEPSDDNSSK